MSKLRIVADTVIDTGSLTALPAITDLDNLKKESRSKVIRFSGATQDINVAIAPTKAISSVVFGRHNITIGTTIRILMYSDVGATTLIHDSGILTVTADESAGSFINWGDFVWGAINWAQTDADQEEFAPQPNYVYWVPTPRLEDIGLTAVFGWTSGVDCDGTVPSMTLPPTEETVYGPISAVQAMTIEIGNITQETEIGRLIAGTYIEPTYNMPFGHTMEWKEDTKQYRTEGGTLRSDLGIPNRRFTFDLGTINEEDRSTISDAMRRVGMRKDFYISLFPEDTNLSKKQDYSGIMKLTKIPSMTEFAPSYYKSKYVMEEV